jgi:Leucine-rich repeat (LRR) protein
VAVIFFLNCSNNYFRYLPTEIQHLIYLRELNVYCNNIRNLPSEIGNLSNLKVLVCSDNLFEKLPEEICNLKKLENIQYLHITKDNIFVPPKLQDFIDKINKKN